MSEQELRELMGYNYPEDDDDKEILLLRVNMFPESINIYADHLDWLYDRTGDWFLVEQLFPELANELTSAKKTYEYFEDFMNSGNLSKIDWSAFYTYVDKTYDCHNDHRYRNYKFFKTVEKYREQLLSPGYDII